MKIVQILMLDESISYDGAHLIIRKVTKIVLDFKTGKTIITSEEKDIEYITDVIDMHGISDDTEENYEHCLTDMKNNIIRELEDMNR